MHCYLLKVYENITKQKCTICTSFNRNYGIINSTRFKKLKISSIFVGN